MENLPAEQVRLSAETPLYEMQDDRVPFEIERKANGVYMVRGKRIERAAAMTYWDNEEAILRFQEILATLGISEALEKAGVKVGDTVIIGEFELEWSE
jgi:GTP-binding protein